MDDLLERSVARLVERVGSTYYGKYRGVVTAVDDPENRCRIRARVDAVLGDTPCAWAEPSMPWAGNGHGMVMLPVVDSAVWIEFEAGQLDRPIWSGAWWAGGQRPEPQGEQLRVIVSEHKHRIVFDDAKDEITIQIEGGPSITLGASEIVLSNGACELRVGSSDVSINGGQVKVGLAGVSLAGGAMTFGTPP